MAKGRSTKLLFAAAAAVLVPAVVLAVLQYRVLISLESETQITVRESSRQTIRAYDGSIDESIYKMSGAALKELLHENVNSHRPEPLLSALRDVLGRHSSVDQVSIARLCECADRFAVMVSRETTSFETGAAADDWPWQRFLARARPSLIRRNDRRVAFLHIEIEREPEFAGLYAFQRSGDVIASLRIPRDVLLDLVRDVSRRQLEPGDEPRGAPEFHLVHETSGAPINPDSPRDGYEMREALGEPLTGWALAAFYRGRSISEITRESLQYNLVLMAVVLATLVFGVVISLSAVARQTRLAQMKASFVSNVSHEMRTPLALITLYSETLEMERFDDAEKIREYQGIIHRESKRLTQMVNNVLDFSRIESGKRDYRFTECSIKDVLHDVLATYREPIIAAGFQLEVDIDEDLPLIRADQNALAQAILNLLDNAVKYSADEKSVAIRVSRRQGSVAIAVEDRGAGIPPSEQTRIFQTFHRVGHPLTSVTRGSGLGLTLAKHTVEAHGGRIELESEVGRGSCFTILLPIAGREPEPNVGGQVVAPHLGS